MTEAEAPTVIAPGNASNCRDAPQNVETADRLGSIRYQPAVGEEGKNEVPAFRMFSCPAWGEMG